MEQELVSFKSDNDRSEQEKELPVENNKELPEEKEEESTVENKKELADGDAEEFCFDQGSVGKVEKE